MRKTRIFLLAAALMAAAVLLTTMPRAQAPEETPRLARAETLAPDAPADSTAVRAAAGCAVTQTMQFSRCGHSVTRRVQAPERVVGADFAAAQMYYDVWTITSFGADSIAMSREIDLFCPMHRVLGCSEAGEIVVSRNVYGDGMAIEKTYPGVTLSDFDPDTQEALRLGLGFDTTAEADAWVAAH
ncbi:MAG: hypothetical protein IJ662_08825 [Clostridia bacterium]|nr:hypothetical protein [Clostridia bacterium]MBR1585628.1 hypothetical protein [Clostridia bacterium]